MNTLKNKLSYIWDYYKFHIIGIPLGVLFLAYVVSAFTGSKETPFSIYFINQDVTIESCSNLEDSLYDKLLLTDELSGVYVDASLIINPETPDAESQMAFTTAISGHTIDVMISDEPFLKHYAKMKAFADLSQTLPANLYNALTPYILLAENEEGVMVPYALDLSSCSYLADLGLHAPVLTIAKYSEHQDICIAFLEFLFSQ